MKKNGFTLIELLAVIIILCITVTIVVIKVENNIKNTSNFENEMKISTLENATKVYVESYYNELSNLKQKNVDLVSLNTLVDKGLLENKDVEDFGTDKLVLVANINGIYKIKYIGTSKNVIFLNGSKEISIYQGDVYNEMGAYVAIPNTGVIELSSSNISSNINTNVKGSYDVIYSCTNAVSETRKIFII